VWQILALKHSGRFLRHVIPAVLRPLRTLWNELIGFLFLTMGTVFGLSAFRSLRAGQGLQCFVAAASAILMAGFGISSFWRARKISRS